MSAGSAEDVNPLGATAGPADSGLDATDAREAGPVAETVASTSGHDRASGPDRLVPGSTLGRYVVVGVVGSGGMGVVYRAHDPELGRLVALKVVRPDPSTADTSQTRSRLVREAQAMAKLSHPNVITVYDAGTVGEQVFIAMELIDGQSLAAWLDERPRSWREIVAIFEQAGRGLHAAHLAGLVHRDFKPVNVLVGRDGRARVLDFGLARATAAEPPADALGTTLPDSERAQLSLTRTGALVGTPRFMAPEQYAGGATDARTDQFGFCVALYHGLFGIYPFRGATVPELMVSVMEGRPAEPPPSRSAPAWLKRLLIRGLAVRPQARFASMAALLATLDAGLKRARRWRIGAAVAVIGVAFVALAFARLRGAAPPGEAPVARFAGSVHQLTFAELAGIPDVSRDGRRVVYAMVSAVVVLDLATGVQIPLFETETVSSIRWSPEGGRLLYVTDRGPKVVSTDGKASRLYPMQTRRTCSAAWAPKGHEVIWRCSGDLHWTMIDVATGASRAVTIALPARAFVADVDWAVTTDMLAIVTLEGAGSTVWTCRPDGSELAYVFHDESRVNTVRWNGTGDRLFYERGRDQSTEIAAIEMTSMPRHPIVAFTVPDVAPGLELSAFALAPDESLIVYVRNTIKQNVVVQSVDAGAAVRPITADVQTKSGFAISPGGEWLAFSAGTAKARRLFRARIDGGAAEPISPLLGEIRQLAWSADEKELVYSIYDASGLHLERFEISTRTSRKVPSGPISNSAHVAWAPNREVLYQRLGNRNYGVVDPDTNEERALIADESVGWTFLATPSPDGRRVALKWSRADESGVWIYSREDGKAFRVTTDGSFPIGWSDDGRWVYTADVFPGGQIGARVVAFDASGTGVSRLVFTTRTSVMDARVVDHERSVLQVTWSTVSNLWMASTQPRSPIPAAPPIPAPADVPQTTPLSAPTNLAFDGVVGQSPIGWLAHGANAVVTDACGASGRCVVFAVPGEEGDLRQVVDARKYRGRRIRFRVRARIEGGPGRLDVSSNLSWTTVASARMELGASGWGTREIVADIAPDAESIELRVSSAGPGKVWLADAALELER